MFCVDNAFEAIEHMLAELRGTLLVPAKAAIQGRHLLEWRT